MGTVVPSWTKAVKYPPCSQVPLECADRAQRGTSEKSNLLLFLSVPQILWLYSPISAMFPVLQDSILSSGQGISHPSLLASLFQWNKNESVFSFGFFLANCKPSLPCKVKKLGRQPGPECSRSALVFPSLWETKTFHWKGATDPERKDMLQVLFHSGQLKKRKKESLKQMKT